MADDKVRFRLAGSLHSARQEIREQIMPFTKKIILTDLQESLGYWAECTGQIITYEYVVWKHINDSQIDINALVAFCKKTPCKVNLIEYNTVEGTGFESASSTTIQQYISCLLYTSPSPRD